MDVAVRGAGHRAPQARSAQDDQQAAAHSLRIDGERRRQDPSAGEREDDPDALQQHVAARKLNGRANDPDSTDPAPPIDRQRGDGHEVIGAESVEKSKQKRGTAEKHERHSRL
jgi:hypothetical protein